MIPLSTILGIAVLYDDYGLGPFDISALSFGPQAKLY